MLCRVVRGRMDYITTMIFSTVVSYVGVAWRGVAWYFVLPYIIIGKEGINASL